MVVTSSSSAFSQMSNPRPRQKDLVHPAQGPLDLARVPISVSWPSASKETKVRRSRAREFSDSEELDSSSREMIVLFLKHVHLQNVGAAVRKWTHLVNMGERAAFDIWEKVGETY